MFSLVELNPSNPHQFLKPSIHVGLPALAGWCNSRNIRKKKVDDDDWGSAKGFFILFVYYMFVLNMMNWG